MSDQIELFPSSVALSPPPESLDEPPPELFMDEPRRPAITLLGEQVQAMDAIRDFLADSSRQHFTLHGLAGAGKTTVLAALARELPRACMCAFTAKAAAVLSRKTGERARTLHSLFYRRVEIRNRVEWAPAHEPGSLGDWVALVDEASMVNEKIGGDILNTGIRVIAAGDPGQLPPVEGKQFFTTPDFTLHEIRRQALESPIIQQAHRVRNGLDYESDGDGFQVIERRSVPQYLDWADIVLCFRNRTRHQINAYIRSQRGVPVNALPRAGEPVICLENCSVAMNGEVFTVAADYRHGAPLALKDGPTIQNVYFETLSERTSWAAPFALAYAITVHKAQGSEWPHVLIRDEFPNNDERQKWLYTAITRASEAVRIVPGRG